MLNDNHHNSSCAFAEQMVSFLYGETDAKEKINFETHLDKCPTCADEFAAFGFVRSSVLEWRDEDFSNLQTPVFEIPTSTKEGSVSWLEGFKRLFTFRPALAAALTALLVCGGLILFATNFLKKTEIAVNLPNKNSTNVLVTPTIERTSEEAVNISDANKEKTLTAKSLPPAEDNVPTPDNSRPSQAVPRNAAFKVSGNNVKSNIANSAQTVSDKNADNRKMSPVRKKQVPTLTNMDDDEDNSVRLSDLFAEIDTK